MEAMIIEYGRFNQNNQTPHQVSQEHQKDYKGDGIGVGGKDASSRGSRGQYSFVFIACLGIAHAFVGDSGTSIVAAP